MTTRDNARRPMAGLTAALALGLVAAGPWPATAKPPDHAPAHGARKNKDKKHTDKDRHLDDRSHRDRRGAPILEGDDRHRDDRPPVPRNPPRPHVVDRRSEEQRRQDARYRRQHDVDLDGIPNDRDRDMDGDGIPNGRDPQPKVFNRPGTVRARTDRDRDGDGIRNNRDHDRDGDGVRNKLDRHPNDRRRH